MRKLVIVVIAFSFLTGNAYAATNKSYPTPSLSMPAKASAKATAKATAASTVKSTAKTTAKATASASATATKKKVVYKPRPRKTVVPSKRSPSPWPPKGFFQNADVYAKIPSKAELLDVIGSDRTGKIGASYAPCYDFGCGTIFTSSIVGCNWWEVSGDLIGPISETDSTVIKIGTINSFFGSSKPKEVKVLVLVTSEPLRNGQLMTNFKLSCHRDPVPSDVKIPSNNYVKAN